VVLVLFFTLHIGYVFWQSRKSLWEAQRVLAPFGPLAPDEMPQVLLHRLGEHGCHLVLTAQFGGAEIKTRCSNRQITANESRPEKAVWPYVLSGMSQSACWRDPSSASNFWSKVKSPGTQLLAMRSPIDLQASCLARR